MKRKLIGMVATVLTIATMTYAKERTVSDGTIGKYVKIEPSKSGTKDYDAIETLEYNMKFPDGLPMVKIPGKDFEILETEVTQELYTSIMGENPSDRKGDNLPVEQVSWYDAIEFCNKLSVMEGLAPVYTRDGNITQNTEANGYRLPTVEEWQYAAKGGENYKYAGSDNLDEVGWYDDNSGDWTHPVGEKRANGYGLYDMSGNVGEWCWDLDYNSGYYSFRSYCGGCYFNGADDCEVSYKVSQDVYYPASNVGFRIVRSASK